MTYGTGAPAGGWSSTTYDWDGRLLTSMQEDGGYPYLTFTYNSDGIRTGKANEDPDYPEYVTYTLDGSTILGEHHEKYDYGNLDATYDVFYYYDENGAPIGLNWNNTDYYYYKNVFGDVLGIMTASGTMVVRYSYDAWGNPISTTGTMSGSLGRINPFRYRGYYYDVETGYYYLQARYYNPNIGRFISPDPVLDTNSAVGLNLYAYCANDPVNFTDATGCLKNVVYMSDAGGGGSSPYIRRILESAKLHEEVGYWHNLAYYDMYPWADPVGDGVVPPDLSSAYYTSDNALYPEYKKECTCYVLGRALEVSGYKTPTSHEKKWYDLTPESERGQVIRSRSIAVFGGSEYGHVVFIEHWNPYSRIVTYSEANYNGRVNGTIRKATWDDFMKERVTSKILIGFIYTD